MQHRKRFASRNWWHGLPVIGCAIMGVGLHVQSNIEIGEFVFRGSLSDLIIIPLFAFPAVVIATDMRRLPWQSILWMLGLCAAITLAYLKGAAMLGGPTSWATTKLAGSYGLLAYLVTGASLCLLAGEQARRAFVVGFVLPGALMVLIYLLTILVPLWPDPIFSGSGRFAGMIGNPNAESLILLFGFFLVILDAGRLDLLLCRGASFVLGALLFVGIVFTGSGAAWAVGAAFLVLVLVLQRKKWITKSRLIAALAIMLALGAIAPLLPGFRHGKLDEAAIKVARTLKLTASVGTLWRSKSIAGTGDVDCKSFWRRNKASYGITIASRIELNCIATRMWLKEPWFGTGLGYFWETLKRNPKATTYKAQTIHSTLLWLLTETGIVGCAFFAAFLVASVGRLWRMARAEPSSEAMSFTIAVLALLAAWQLMSFAHELMYQRFVWIALGMALVRGRCSILQPAKQPQGH